MDTDANKYLGGEYPVYQRMGKAQAVSIMPPR
jgi:hypothetical protein